MKVGVILVFLFVFLQSCDNRVARVVKEWEDKEILFPKHSVFTIQGDDTVSPPAKDATYKVLVYVDTTGCTSCRLRLPLWKSFIKEVDSLSSAPVAFYFYLFPKSVKEMRNLLKRDQFTYPVCIDTADALNRLNGFPEEDAFQTFLLNTNNHIVAIGNPIHNPAVKELYLGLVTHKDKRQTRAQLVNTKLDIDKREVELGKVSLPSTGKNAMFVLRNVGDHPLLITDVVTSCGCTKVEYKKEFVKPGEETTLTVRFVPEEEGFFRKAIMVHCNAEGSPFRLVLKGRAVR